MPHVVGDAFQALPVEHQAVVEGVAALHACQVAGVGLQELGLLGDDGVGYVEQHLVLLLVADEGQFAAGSLGALECVYELQFHVFFVVG